MFWTCYTPFVSGLTVSLAPWGMLNALTVGQNTQSQPPQQRPCPCAHHDMSTVPTPWYCDKPQSHPAPVQVTMATENLHSFLHVTVLGLPYHHAPETSLLGIRITKASSSGVYASIHQCYHDFTGLVLYTNWYAVTHFCRLVIQFHITTPLLQARETRLTFITLSFLAEPDDQITSMYAEAPHPDLWTSDW